MVKSHALAQRVLTLGGYHLHSYIQAKEAIERKQSSPVQPSQFWEDTARLLSHILLCTNLLLRSHVLVDPAVPKPHLETGTGLHVVVEQITCSVIFPLFNKLSDPDWIHLILVDIFSGARNDRAQAAKSLYTPDALEQPSVPTSLQLILEVESLPEGQASFPGAATVLLNSSEAGPSS